MSPLNESLASLGDNDTQDTRMFWLDAMHSLYDMSTGQLIKHAKLDRDIANSLSARAKKAAKEEFRKPIAESLPGR